MTAHLVILPVLVPLLAAVAVMLMPARNYAGRRLVSLTGSVALIMVVAALLDAILTAGTQAYFVGDWPAPFGIALVADRASVLLLLTTSMLALSALMFAVRGEDGRGRRYHALFHFQVMGVNGAFLAADLFNLFVFFEILLIASYSLLMHGAGKARTRAALHYVILNLTGSSLFLIALGMLYAGLGTLNLAHMASLVGSVTGQSELLVRGAGLLLLVVFGLKGGLLPLLFWLPRTYAAAVGSVGALFAIMTKVGIYAMLRVFYLLFGDHAGNLAGLMDAWLWPLGLGTLVMGAVGVLAADSLRKIVVWLVVVSAGTLVVVVSWRDMASTAGALYYLMHTTWITGALFMLVALLRQQCGDTGDLLKQMTARPGAGMGALFLVSAIVAVGLPPFSGFFAKAQLLLGTVALQGAVPYWWAVLVASLVVLVALSRAGTSLFWRRDDQGVAGLDRFGLAPAAALILATVMLVIFMRPVMTFSQGAAMDLLDVQGYQRVVLGTQEGRP